MNFFEPYGNRTIQIQIYINEMRGCYPYPFSFYEGKTDREISEMHRSKLSEMAAISIETYKREIQIESKKPKQLTFF